MFRKLILLVVIVVLAGFILKAWDNAASTFRPWEGLFSEGQVRIIRMDRKLFGGFSQRWLLEVDPKVLDGFGGRVEQLNEDLNRNYSSVIKHAQEFAGGFKRDGFSERSRVWKRWYPDGDLHEGAYIDFVVSESNALVFIEYEKD